MKFTTQIQDQTGTVKLEGTFTFETHPAFRAYTRSLLDTPGLERIVLDMEQVTRMDASSLGAILLLREATRTRMAIALQRPSASVLSLLKVVHFDKLFEIIA